MEYNQFIASNNENNAGGLNTFAKISGITLRVNNPFQAIVYLFNPTSKQAFSTISGADGTYSFKGLPKGQSFLVFAQDLSKQYNAVIQDNVVPK